MSLGRVKSLIWQIGNGVDWVLDGRVADKIAFVTIPTNWAIADLVSEQDAGLVFDPVAGSGVIDKFLTWVKVFLVPEIFVTFTFVIIWLAISITLWYV